MGPQWFWWTPGEGRQSPFHPHLVTRKKGTGGGKWEKKGGDGNIFGGIPRKLEPCCPTNPKTRVYPPPPFGKMQCHLVSQDLFSILHEETLLHRTRLLPLPTQMTRQFLHIVFILSLVDHQPTPHKKSLWSPGGVANLFRHQEGGATRRVVWSAKGMGNSRLSQ